MSLTKYDDDILYDAPILYDGEAGAEGAWAYQLMRAPTRRLVDDEEDVLMAWYAMEEM